VLSFSIGATKELTLLPDWRVICHPRVYEVFSLSQLTDAEHGEEFRNSLSYCDPFNVAYSTSLSAMARSVWLRHTLAAQLSLLSHRPLQLGSLFATSLLCGRAPLQGR